MYVFKSWYFELTLILLTWRIWWAPNNASRWRMGFKSAFKGLKFTQKCWSTVTFVQGTFEVASTFMKTCCFPWNETILCFMRVFDVVAMLITCSIINHLTWQKLYTYMHTHIHTNWHKIYILHAAYFIN